MPHSPWSITISQRRDVMHRFSTWTLLLLTLVWSCLLDHPLVELRMHMTLGFNLKKVVFIINTTRNYVSVWAVSMNILCTSSIELMFAFFCFVSIKRCQQHCRIDWVGIKYENHWFLWEESWRFDHTRLHVPCSSWRSWRCLLTVPWHKDDYDYATMEITLTLTITMMVGMYFIWTRLGFTRTKLVQALLLVSILTWPTFRVHLCVCQFTNS